jgi:hypothetical protein
MKKFLAVLLAVVGFAMVTPSPAAAGVHFGFFFGPPAVYYGGPYYYPGYYPYYYPYYGYGYYRPYYGYYGYHHGYWGHRYWGHGYYHGYHHWH